MCIRDRNDSIEVTLPTKSLREIERFLVSSNQNDLTQSVLEGVSFALRDNLEALKIAGTNISSATAISLPFIETISSSNLGMFPLAHF